MKSEEIKLTIVKEFSQMMKSTDDLLKLEDLVRRVRNLNDEIVECMFEKKGMDGVINLITLSLSIDNLNKNW